MYSKNFSRMLLFSEIKSVDSLSDSLINYIFRNHHHRHKQIDEPGHYKK